MLAFAQKHAAEEEGDEISTDEWDLESAFVRKLSCTGWNGTVYS